MAHDISAKVAYKKISLRKASEKVIQKKLSNLGGTDRIVAIDKDRIGLEFNTEGMYRTPMNAKGVLEIGIYKE